MKITITFDDFEAVTAGVSDAVTASLPEGLTQDERDQLHDQRCDEQEDLLGRWLGCRPLDETTATPPGMVTIEFDTEAGTAVVKEMLQ